MPLGRDLGFLPGDVNEKLNPWMQPIYDNLELLLGLEQKLRQYREGKAFCDAVVAAGEIEALDQVWTAPAALPTPDELASPAAWLARVGA